MKDTEKRTAGFKAGIWYFILLVLAGQVFAQKPEERVTVRDVTEVDILNPYLSISTTSTNINELLYQSLLANDKATLKMVPVIADSLPLVSADGLFYTYRIDQMAKWNSGRPITAGDVLFTMKIVKNPYLTNFNTRKTYANVVDAIEIDDRTVQFVLAKPSPFALTITGDLQLISSSFFDPGSLIRDIPVKALNDPASLTEAQNSALREIADKVNLFGSSLSTYSAEATSGPYILQDWQKDGPILLAKNKRFWGMKLKAPKNIFFIQNVELIEFKTVKDENVARAMLLEGTLDCANGLSTNVFFELEELPQLKSRFYFHTPETMSYLYVGMNLRPEKTGRKPLLTDVKVRKAMAYLIDVDYLLETTAYGLGMRLPSAVYPFKKEEYNKDLVIIRHDLDTAKHLLAEAGWKDTDGNGFLDKSIFGVRTDLTLDFIVDDAYAQRKEIAESFRENAKAAGVNINIVVLPWSQYFQTLHERNFDMFVGSWMQKSLNSSFQQMWHSHASERGGINFVGFGNEHTDSLVEQYDVETDLQKRNELSKTIQKIIYDEQPCIFLWVPTDKIVINKRFSNVRSYHFRPGVYIPEWVPER